MRKVLDLVFVAVNNMLNWKDNTERINATYKREKSFVCVEYPGIIQNTQKAISTLGGQEKINKARLSYVFVGCTK